MFTLLSSIHLKPEYITIMGASLIIIISFIFNFISKKTSIPSVLLLLILGVGIQLFFKDLKDDPLISQLLIVVGKVGLILIVLEAALDLKIQKDKIGLIVKSLTMALFALVGSALIIAFAIEYFMDTTFYKALVYAVPLSIMSSAIIIPSVGSLEESKKEFMIYESTFSDILGIIFFQFLTSSEKHEGPADVALNVGVDLLMTIGIAIVLSYMLVWMFQKLTSSVKLFLIIAVLMLVYAVGSVLGISSLIIILFFGLILNNTKIFFRGPLKNVIDEEKIKPVFHEFHIITLESAFVLRTFFFVMFGVSISLMSLVDWHVAFYSMVIVGVLYAVRFILLKIILFGKSISPELYIAPRGLITVLLFYTIPNGLNEAGDYIPENDMTISNFDPGILLYTILITSVIMTISLIVARGQKVKDVLIDNLNINYIEDDAVKAQHDEEKEYFDEMDKEFEKEEGKEDNSNPEDTESNPTEEKPEN